MTLLVGFSPGKDDRSGLEFAATLARSSGQSLLVVTVMPAMWPTPVAGHTDREYEAWAAATGATAVAEAEAVLADHCADVEAEAIWVPGRSVPGALLDQAVRSEAAMIVVGSGHDGTYGRVHLNSTADRLLHSSPVPVALATRGYHASEHHGVGRVTCSFRGDEASSRTLERTAQVCADVEAKLRVATFAVRGRTMYPPEVSPHSEDDVMTAWVDQAEAAQQTAIAALPGAGIAALSIESVVVTGRSWAAVLDQLPWESDDVLVVGSSSSAGFLARLFLGSNAAKIVRHSPVPVIVVPA